VAKSFVDSGGYRDFMTEEECAIHDFDEPAIMKGAAISLMETL
jgi:hypothetical protein